MRQRKIKHLEEKYNNYSDIVIYEPSELRGHWSERAGGRPIYIEIGCGKGKFISEIAARQPDNFFVAIEGNRSVMLRALEKVRDAKLDNVVFAPDFVDDLTEWFGDAEADGIYLNFSDPLPKNYWYRRRLTYRERLKTYFRVLKADGRVVFKTDNTGLFEWSIQEILAADLKILDITRDLHAAAAAIEDPAERADFNIETEYEAKFSGQGEKIKRVVIGRRPGAAYEFLHDAGTEADAETDTAADIKKEDEMSIKSMVTFNGREIPEGDRNFTAVARAKAAIAEKGKANVINGTVGALYDDDANLVVLDSVTETLKTLSGPDFAEYAPIAGLPGFREAIKKAAFGSFEPKSYIGVVATPGGTGAIRTAVDNYSCPGDRILSHSWYWGPYSSIAVEQGKSLETFEMFDEEGNFNIADFGYKVSKLLRNQEHLVIILNTPASNPTGYSLSMDDWYGVKEVLDNVDLEKKVALVCDVAYMDFAGEESETRAFLQVIDNLRANVLPIIAYSASKTFTMYGARCAAMICLAHNPEVAAEFEKACSFAARNTWSNPPRAPQVVIEKIYSDPELLAKVDAERKHWRDMLLARGKAFEKAAREAGLEMVPFRAGFFVTIPYKDPDALINALAKKDVFLIPVNGGVRVSVASVAEKNCAKLPAIIKETIAELG